MKKMKNLSLCIVIFTMLAVLMSVSAFADFSGRDGDIIWTVDTTDGTLTIEGSGAIGTYAGGKAPWYDYNSYVKNIVVKSGITSISKGAFYGMEYVNSLTVPFVGGSASSNTFIGYVFGGGEIYDNINFVPATLKTVTVTGSTSIESYAFNDCETIEEVIIADTVTTINSYAFKNCFSLDTVVIGSGVKNINENAFYNCSALKNVLYNSTTSKWSAVSVDATNAIKPVCLGDGTLTVTAPSKTVYKLGEKFNTAGIKATFNSKDVTSAVKIITPDMSSIGTKTYTVVYGLLSVSGQITVTANETSGVAGSICWSFNEANGELTISGEGVMDNYTLEILPPWYKYRNDIKTVTIQSGVESIGDYAFYYHSALKTVTVAETVETIGFAAFEGCSVLSTVTLGNIYAPVDGTAFRGCDALVVTENGNEYLSVSGNKYYMLKSVGDKSVTSFSVPESTVVIGEGAFENCTALKSLLVPNSVISIGDSAFKGCTALGNVQFGTYVTLIGNSAFEDCTSLTTVTFTAVPKDIGVLAFASCPLNTTTYNNAEYIGSVANPHMVLLSATSTDIESCELHENTKIIAALAFANCKSLRTVELPDGLLNISDSAFNGCTALYSVDVPQSVVSIGSLAFSDCTSLEVVTFGEFVEVIGNGAFRGDTALESIAIPMSTKLLGYNAFRGCTSLKTVGVSDGVKSIGYKTFEGCTKLANVYLPNSLYSIGDYVFKGCTSLKSIAVPHTTAAMGFGAFAGCKSLEAASLPFAGDKANGAYSFIGYNFGAISADTNGKVVPSTLKTLLIGSSIGSDDLAGVSLDTIIFDKTLTSIASANVSATKMYYLGNATEWASVSGNDAYASVTFLNSTFVVEDPTEFEYSAGDMIDISFFTATSGDLNILPLIRFKSNPIQVSGSSVDVPVYFGSVLGEFVSDVTDYVEMGDYSLILEGSIGVKVYVNLTPYAMLHFDDIVTTVDFNGETYESKLVSAGDAGNKTLHYAKFYVAAKEMHDEITFTVSAADSSVTKTVSVKGYVDSINKNSAEFEDVVSLINALYDFGEYSRIYFNYGTATNPAAPSEDISQTEITVSTNYTPVKVGNISGIYHRSTSLLLESNTTVRHYFKLGSSANINNYTFVTDGNVELTPVAKDGYYYVDIPNILAHKLGEMRVLTVSNANGSIKYAYSPVSYVKLVLDNESNEAANLVNLAKALYNYFDEARAYFKLINEADIVPEENESSSQIW